MCCLCCLTACLPAHHVIFNGGLVLLLLGHLRASRQGTSRDEGEQSGGGQLHVPPGTGVPSAAIGLMTARQLLASCPSTQPQHPAAASHPTPNPCSSASHPPPSHPSRTLQSDTNDGRNLAVISSWQPEGTPGKPASHQAQSLSPAPRRQCFSSCARRGKGRGGRGQQERVSSGASDRGRGHQGGQGPRERGASLQRPVLTGENERWQCIIMCLASTG